MNFQLTSDTLVPFIISNVVAIFILSLSILRPGTSRGLLFLLFFGAGAFNIYTAFSNPLSYLEFQNGAFLPIYKEFISSYFAQHTTVLVLLIAVFQIFIALSIIINGVRFKLACIGGILFGLAIAPLGIGSAFPSSLLLSASFLILLVNKEKQSDARTPIYDY